MEPNAEQSIDPIVQIVNNYYQESYHAKRIRMFDNSDNFNCYHFRQDYSHKKAGQSQEFLPKVFEAVEQITSFMQQGLIDEQNWFGIENEAGMNPDIMKISPTEMQKLLERELNNNEIESLIPDAIKLGLLGSLMIVKVHGGYQKKEKFFSKSESPTATGGGAPKLFKTSNQEWRLKLELVRQEDWYPDPTGEGLYEMQVIEMDWYKLYDIAAANPDIYDMEMVMNCGTMVQEEQKMKKSRETDQNTTFSAYRRRIKIKELWGDIIEQGTGKVLYKNVVCAVANDHYLIRPPKPNPFWHGSSPFVVCPIVRVPHSVWHKALMDAPTKLNRALNEMFNLMFDSGMMSTFGIKQVREGWLDDPAEIDDGVMPGQTLKVNTSCPPGQKVLERVDTGGNPSEAIAMYNLADKEYQASSMSSDVRNGVLPQRQVKATEIVAANQTITGMFNGIVKTIESKFAVKLIEKSWLTTAQYLNAIDIDELSALFGEQRAIALNAITPADRFADTVKGRKYKVFGMSSVLNKINDFRKVTTLMQTIAQSPPLTQEFAKKYDFGKLLGVIMKALDIDVDKIKLESPDNSQANPQQLAGMVMGGGDQMSQIPNMGAQSNASETMPGVQRGPSKMGLTNPGGNA